MVVNAPPSDDGALYVNVKTDGSPPPSPRSAEAPLRPLAAASHDYGETPLAGGSSNTRSPTEKPLARLVRTALLVAVPAVVLLVAAAVLLAAVAGSGPGGQLFSGAQPDYDVLVVGAGAAGLAAAKQLREQGGLKVILSRHHAVQQIAVALDSLTWPFYHRSRVPLGSMFGGILCARFDQTLISRAIHKPGQELLLLDRMSTAQAIMLAAPSGGGRRGVAAGRRARAHVAGA